jgi:hypothetical protein
MSKILLAVATICGLLMYTAHGYTVLNSDVGTYSEVVSTRCGQYSYFRVVHTAPCLDLGIELDVASGDPDIYVSKGYNNDTFYYLDKSSLSWSTYGDGVNSIIISHWDTEFSEGNFDVAVYNDCAYQSETASYRIRAYTYDDPNDKSDVLKYPEQAMNRVLYVENFDTHEAYTTNDAYHYYRFCLPQCADVRVNLQNCISNAECPGEYSYPELLLSRTEPTPQLSDYQYNLWFLRHIDVNRTDPGGRDVNGYMTGTYYFSVYGWCTPNDYVQVRFKLICPKVLKIHTPHNFALIHSLRLHSQL